MNECGLGPCFVDLESYEGNTKHDIGEFCSIHAVT